MSRGDNPTLKEDEGYLFLSLDSSDYIASLQLKNKKSGKKIKFNKVEPGLNHAMIKLKAGEYYWDRFKYYFTNSSLVFNFGESDYDFKIEPGVINYPGSWKAKLATVGSSRYKLTMYSENRLSTEYKKIRIQYKELYERILFKFQGAVIDNYPTFYQQIVKSFKQNTILNNKNLSLPSLSVTKEENTIYYDKSEGNSKELKSLKNMKKYFTDTNQSIGNLNPSGEFLVYSSIESEVTRIEVLNLNKLKSYSIFKENLPKNSFIESLKWIDEDTIFYQLRLSNYIFNRVVHLTIENDKVLKSSDHLNIPISGKLIDTLLTDGNHIYFANTNFRSKNKHGLFKIDTTSKKSMKKTSRKKYIKDKKFKNAAYWLTDEKSHIRFIITFEFNKKDETVQFDYWFLPRDEKNWLKIKSYSSEDDIEVPEYLSKDDSFFYVLTNQFSDKKAIHKYSTKDFSYDSLFYEDKNIEIIGMNTDPSTHEIIGVTHVLDGFFKIKYFDNAIDVIKPVIKRNPHTKFYSIHHNLNSNKVLIYGNNEYSKGAWYIYDTSNDKLIKLFEVNSEYQKLSKGIFYHLNVKSLDGVNIEGYLILPNDENKTDIPLIVMPHGGPIGVRDYASRNELQHFYASLGYATLKINYRGSGGFGKKFQESGQQQWGEKIEEDINNMVDYTLNNFNISKSKICSMGSSYGGYSAIMLPILYPNRYKCTVSFAGVTDLPLLFSSSYFKNNEKLFDRISSIVGNPLVNYQGLINKSPTYLTHKLTKPILLVHGINDHIVPIEHSLRFKEIADLVGLDISLIVLLNEGHSTNHLESKLTYIAKSINFINEQLYHQPLIDNNNDTSTDKVTNL